MKKVVIIVSGVLLFALPLLASCSTKAAAPATKTITGTVVSVNTPAQPGPDQITIQTAAGQQKSFTIDPTSNVSLDGFVCPIEQVGQTISTGNATYNCTIVYDETYHAIAAGVYKIVQ